MRPMRWSTWQAVNDMQATDVKARVERLVRDEGWGIVDAADGLILLAKGARGAELPAGLLHFHTGKAEPQIPVEAQFGPGLRFTGFDVRRRAALAHHPLPVLPRAPDRRPAAPRPGDPLHRPRSGRERGGRRSLRPTPALLWRPPSTWQKGESVVVETTPWYLPRAFAPVLSVASGGQTVRAELAQRRRARTDRCKRAGPRRRSRAATDRCRLPAFARRDGLVDVYEAPLYPVDKAEATFAGRKLERPAAGIERAARRGPRRPAARAAVLAGRSARLRGTTTSSCTCAMRRTRPSPWATRQPTWFTPAPDQRLASRKRRTCGRDRRTLNRRACRPGARPL